MTSISAKLKDQVLRQYDTLKDADPEYAKLLKVVHAYHEAEQSIKALQIRQKGMFSDMGRSQYTLLIKNQCDQQLTHVETATSIVRTTLDNLVALQGINPSPAELDAVCSQIVQEYIGLNEACFV